MTKTRIKPTATDWDRVKREALQDSPNAHGVADGLYYHNDAAAVASYWPLANIKRGRGRPTGAVKRPALNMRVDADVLEAFKATGLG